MSFITIRGTVLDQQDHGGRCALHYAALSDQKSLCQQLLKSGASPNVQVYSSPNNSLKEAIAILHSRMVKETQHCIYHYQQISQILNVYKYSAMPNTIGICRMFLAELLSIGFVHWASQTF